MTEPSKRTLKSLSASSSISDLSFEDVRLEDASKVSSNRTGTERSGSVGLPPAQFTAGREDTSSAIEAEPKAGKPALEDEPEVEISWRGAPPAAPTGPAIAVDPAALRENLATFAGQAASTAGQAANTLSDATLAASSKVLLSSVRGREILMEKLSQQIPPQAGSWLTEGFTNWSSGLTDTVHTGLNAVQQLWANADASIKRAAEEGSNIDEQGSDEVRGMFGLGEDEELMEAFKCQLLQNYTCTDNSFTPNQQVAFAGRLYMTGGHLCFHSSPAVHFKIQLQSLKKIEKSIQASKDVASLEVVAGDKLIFGGFAALDLDNFLALAWHFTSDTN